MAGTHIKIEEVRGDVNYSESPEFKVDSIINEIIGQISQIDVKINIRDRSFPSKVLNKINHNELKGNRTIVALYKNYSAHIESAYSILEKSVVNGKQIAMWKLHDMYNSALKSFDIDVWEPDVEAVRKVSDEIIDDVKSQLGKFLYRSSNIRFSKEQMSMGIDIVIAHAFVECNILENPNDPS